MTDVTHLCHFDIPLLANIPNLVYLAPTNREEYLAMLDWSIDYREHPVAIRVPFGPVAAADRPVPTDFSALNTYEVVCRGKDVAILALGNFFTLGQQVCRLLEGRGIHATLVNPRFISGTDAALLDSLATDHRLVVTLEDGVLDGGFYDGSVDSFHRPNKWSEAEGHRVIERFGTPEGVVGYPSRGEPRRVKRAIAAICEYLNLMVEDILAAYPAGEVPDPRKFSLRPYEEIEPCLREPLSEGWKSVHELPRRGMFID